MTPTAIPTTTPSHFAIGRLKPGLGSYPVQRSAVRVLKAQNKLYTQEGNFKKFNQQIKSHLLDGGVYAIKELARSAGNKEALALLEEYPPAGEFTLQELRGIRGRKNINDSQES